MEQETQRTILSREESLRRQAKGEGVGLAAQLLNGKIKPGEFAEKWAEGRMREIKDHLTGLFSRGFFEAELKIRLAAAARNDRPLALLMVDVDKFKETNDNYGHPAGDEVLRGMGRTIAEITRESDVAARYGGEEVVVILPETDEDGAEIAAERLRKKIEATKIEFQGMVIPCTVSVGLAVYPQDGEDKEKLVGKADQALYAAKRAGRNCVRKFSQIPVENL